METEEKNFFYKVLSRLHIFMLRDRENSAGADVCEK